MYLVLHIVPTIKMHFSVFSVGNIKIPKILCVNINQKFNVFPGPKGSRGRMKFLFSAFQSTEETF